MTRWAALPVRAPSPVHGRVAVGAHFRAMFQSPRKNSPTPRLHIQPRDVFIQLAGAIHASNAAERQ